MSAMTSENLNLEKACLVNIGFNDSVCEAMVERNKSGYTVDQEIEVQKLVTSMVAFKSAVLGMFPFLFMLFVGSWSDRHKIRKPFILIPICGHIIMNFGCFICSFFFLDLPAEIGIFFESVPEALTGTWLCFYLGIHCYVCENSSRDKRTFLFGIIVITSCSSLFVGISVSGVLYRVLGFNGVYSLSFFICVINVIYGNCVIKDVSSYKNISTETNILKDIFDYRHTFSSIFVLFTNKNKKRTLSLILILVINTVRVGPKRGQESVRYMFTRQKFTWDEVDYSNYMSYHSLVSFVGSFICVSIFVKWMKLDDAIIGMITMASGISGSLMCSIVPNGYYFYLAALPEIFAFSDQVVMAPIISKLVSPDKLGQLFSLCALVEALGPLIFGPVYSFVYYKTIHTFPAAFFTLSSCIEAVTLLLFLWLYSLKIIHSVEVDENEMEELGRSCKSENPEEMKMMTQGR